MRRSPPRATVQMPGPAPVNAKDPAVCAIVAGDAEVADVVAEVPGGLDAAGEISVAAAVLTFEFPEPSPPL
jgi:hypothetical protein